MNRKRYEKVRKLAEESPFPGERAAARERMLHMEERAAARENLKISPDVFWGLKVVAGSGITKMTTW